MAAFDVGESAPVEDSLELSWGCSMVNRAQWASDILTKIKREWKSTGKADAAAALRQYPELSDVRACVVDLAHEEFSFRLAGGEELSATYFAGRFPGYQHSIVKSIAVQQIIDEVEEEIELDEPDWPEPGERFLEYELSAELGRGGMGRVFLAHDAELERYLVIKLTPIGRHEALTMARLEHDNIVDVFFTEEDWDRKLFGIVMPFQGHATLQDQLDVVFPQDVDQTFPFFAKSLVEHEPPESIKKILGDYEPGDNAKFHSRFYVDAILQIGVELAAALEHAHRRGVLHRDLKPSNVLLTRGGKPMLIDFNLAKDGQEERECLDGGTIPYMSPERLAQLQGEKPGADEDHRSDIYAVGVLLYELLTGRHPFADKLIVKNGESALQELRVNQRTLPKPANEINRRVDSGIAEVIQDCLRYDPNSRPESATALKNSLQAHQSRYATARRWAMHRPWFACAAGVAVLTLVLLLMSPLFFTSRSYRMWAGRTAATHGDTSEATAQFDAVLYANPDDEEARRERAKVHFESQNWVGAVLDFDHILKKDYSQSELKEQREAALQHLLDQAWKEYDDGSPAEAVKKFSVIIELDPSCLDAVLGRAKSKVKNEDIDGAVGELSSLHVRTLDPHYLILAGNILGRARRYDDAAAQFLRAMRFVQIGRLYSNYAVCRGKEYAIADAEHWFAKAEALDDDLPYVYWRARTANQLRGYAAGEEMIPETIRFAETAFDKGEKYWITGKMKALVYFYLRDDDQRIPDIIDSLRSSFEHGNPQTHCDDWDSRTDVSSDPRFVRFRTVAPNLAQGKRLLSPDELFDIYVEEEDKRELPNLYR